MLAALAIGFAVGCGSDSTGPSKTNQGSVKFNYSGALSGGFSASGTPKVDIDNIKSSFAVAMRDDSTGMVAVAAFQIKSGTRGDMAVFIVEKEEVGSYDMSFEDCEENCAMALFYFNVDFETGISEDSHAFISDSGAVKLTSVSAKQLKGTFSGSAIDLMDEDSKLKFTNGSFSAPVVDMGLPMPDVSMMLSVPSLESATATIEGFNRLPAARQARILDAMERLGAQR